ncbi:MAG: phosphotransferase [Solirubrobacteraceae bacterium]
MRLADALSGRAGPEGVRWLLLGSEPRRAVRDALHGLLAEDHRIPSLRMHRAKFKPGRKLSAWYVVDVADDRGGRSARHVAVTWVPDNANRPAVDDEQVARLEEEAAARRLMAPFRSLHEWLPEWRARILVSPLDVGFPSLMRLSDPGYAAGLLPGSDGAAPLVATIRYRPGERHVLRYQPAPSTPGDATPVFAKLYADGRAERIGRSVADVAEWLAAAGDGVGAVSPMAVRDGDGALLYAGLDGAPLSRAPEALRRAGAALRLLHTAPPALTIAGEARGLDDELAAAARTGQHIDALLPRVGGAARAVLDAAASAAEQIPGEPATLVHGDLKLDHIWDLDGRLTLLDLDRCHTGDPAFDVGKLLADLRWRSVMAGRRGADRAQERLLEGYGEVPRARLHRARVYEAVLLVKIAARRVPLFDRRWADLTASLVAAGGEVLSQHVLLERGRRDLEAIA